MIRRLPVALAAAALVAAGCVAPPEAPVTTAERVHSLAGGWVVASNAGRLVGKVKAPDGGLIASNGAAILASNGASILASNGAAYVARYRALALEAAGGASVRVLNERGEALTTASSTDEAGGFAFRRLKPSTPAVVVAATVERGGQTLTLTSIVTAPRKAGAIEVAVDPATTWIAKRALAAVRLGAMPASALDGRRLEQLASKLAPELDDKAAVAAALLGDEAAARTFDAWLASKPALQASLRGLMGSHALQDLLKPMVVPQKPALSTPAPTPEPTPAPPNAAMGVFGVAGYGQAGYADGPMGQARFNVPYDVATDAQGNTYVADSENHAVRKIAPDGTVTTLAGNGTPGYKDGQGSAARFKELSGVAVAPDGTVYVADWGNHAIRKITPDGVVTTLAGDGTPGYKDGQGQDARLNGPPDLTVAPDGNVYVADEMNNVIRKITPDGLVTTVAGDGTPGFTDGGKGVGKLSGPQDVAIDRQGVLFVADTGNHAIRRIDPDGRITTLAGAGEAGYADGVGKAAKFDTPFGVVVAGADTIYVADSNNNAVRRIQSDGTVTTFAGGTAQAYRVSGARDPLFAGPSGLAIRMNNEGQGEVFVANAFSHRITKFRLRVQAAEELVPK